ncbi:MAG TPA: TatD family hydrolase [Patescibacteria group bacterium]|nr:TatD family hydrolase [Patescibacteria group bacterium]
MFDTHCHLNFSRFKKNVDEVIQRAKDAGVTRFVVPGTDVESSKRAVELAEKYEGVYAAVGIHPHHVFTYMSRHSELDSESIKSDRSRIKSGMTNDLSNINRLLSHPKVVAGGEIGLDKHVYKQTKYESYHVTPEFITRQKQLLIEQLQLAITHNKSVILHNREATDELLELLINNWNTHFEGRMVFHCCEPDRRLLDFALTHHVYIGVDGDVTYDLTKQDFIKQVPLELLVVETDSPFLLPEPLRSRKEYPNEPKNLPLIITLISKLKSRSPQEIETTTAANARILFAL